MAEPEKKQADGEKEKPGAGSSAVDPLRKALAATWGFYFEAQSFHWNVTGDRFVQMHDLFGSIYRDAQWATDDLAERIRTLGAYAPMSPTEIGEQSGITFAEGDMPPDAQAMTRKLATDNRTVIAALDAAQKAATEADEPGLANYLQGRMDSHKKWGWQLDALLTEASVKDIAKRPRDTRLGELLEKAGTKSDD